MKIKLKLKYILIASLASQSNISSAHNIPVHQAITFNSQESAHDNSSAYTSFLNTVASDVAYEDATNSMVKGSGFEDNKDVDENGNKDVGGKRSLNHFYDPLDHIYSKGLSDAPFVGRLVTGTNSLVWASISNSLGFNYKGHPFVGDGNINTSNIWSWQNARGYQWIGLTAASRNDRQTSLLNMFRSVGQVIHLLEDTSQPQHVRNEQHLDKVFGHNSDWRSPIEDYGQKNVNTLNYQHAMLDWKGAGFTKLEDFWDRHLYNGSSAALNADLTGGANTLGLAEWCNGNFLGVRHTYAEDYKSGELGYYPFPSRDTGTQYNPNWQSPLTPIDGSFLKDGSPVKRVYLHKIKDGIDILHHSVLGYLDVTTITSSQLSAQLQRKFRTPTINDPEVLLEYHSILIPKAVKYSAGLLDYFFRGKLNATAFIDCDGILKLNIQNQSGQTLKGGTFQAYWDDVSGNRTPMNGSQFALTWPPVSELANNDSTNAIVTPVTGAVKYILVYKGTLGIDNSHNALDTVDDTIAIAAKSFTLPTCPDQTAPKWQNTTKVSDYHLTGGNPVAGSGIAPYSRNLESGLVPNCAPGTDCSHPPSSGNPLCGNWRSKLNSIMPPGLEDEAPFGPNGVKACSDPQAQQIDYNCYLPAAGSLVANRRCAQGFKNLQARKQWHGKFNYISEENLPPTALTVSDGTGGGVVGYPLGYCYGEQMTPDQTKYLTATLTATFKRTKNSSWPIPFPDFDTSLSRVVSVGRKTGIRTLSYSNPSFPTSPYIDPAPYISRSIAVSEYNLSSVANLFLGRLQEMYSENQDKTITRSGNTWTMRGNLDQLVYRTITIDLAGRSFVDKQWALLCQDGTCSTRTWQLVSTETISLAATSVSRNLVTDSDFSQGFGIIHYEEAQTCNLTITYTAQQTYQDAKDLIDAGFWNLDDDNVYPWRGDGFLSIAPMLTYAEVPANVTPSMAGTPLKGTVDDYSQPQTGTGTIEDPFVTPQRAWFDEQNYYWLFPANGSYPTSLATLTGPFYDGSVLGKPGKPGDKAFSWNHKVWAVCGDNALYIKGYGARPGDDGAAVPDTATQWTELREATSLPGGGNFTRQLPGGPIWIQQSIQLDAATTAQDWSRPCGLDAALMDETTVHCITQASGSAGSMTFTLNDSPTGIGAGNQLVVTGGYNDGYYTVASVSANSIIASRTGDLPAGFNYPYESQPQAVLGKRRFPGAPATCDPAWSNKTRKGNFAILTWGFNYRDFAERDRVFNNSGTAAACAPGGGKLRLNQASHGMPREVNTFTAGQGQCAGTPNIYNVPQNPCGRVLKPLDLPANFSGDERFGSRWQSVVQNVMQELYWQPPHRKCSLQAGVEADPNARWEEAPDGQCIDDFLDSENVFHAYYANRPWVECVVNQPTGSPPLPPGIYVGYLSLGALDTSGAVTQNVAPPLDTPIANQYLAGPQPDFWTPWSVLKNKCNCINNHGRFEAVYTAQGVKCCE